VVAWDGPKRVSASVPRDLGDVIDYFLPDRRAHGAAGLPPGPREACPDPRPRPERPAALPIVALPIGGRDVVRAAFAWNLTVELARCGASASLLAPEEPEPSLLWPDGGPGPLGSELLFAPCRGIADLARAALDLAVERAADAPDGGVVLARVPPEWLRAPRDGRALLRWVLLFATPEGAELHEAYALAKHLLGASPEARVGVTVHGVRRVAEAEATFARVAGVAARHLGARLWSYGFLVDDLHVYRAIAARRPVGLEHPQSRAARALRDVARLILEDARSGALA